MVPSPTQAESPGFRVPCRKDVIETSGHHILAGLIAAGVLGLMFSNTRMVGVACTALLCYLFPIVALILALLGLLVLFFLHRRKTRKDFP